MYTIGAAIAGVLIGALGSELLRLKHPELVKKVEDSAKHTADALWPSPSAPRNAEENKEPTE